jgi:hypothetical protein
MDQGVLDPSRAIGRTRSQRRTIMSQVFEGALAFRDHLILFPSSSQSKLRRSLLREEESELTEFAFDLV